MEKLIIIQYNIIYIKIIYIVYIIIQYDERQATNRKTKIK